MRYLKCVSIYLRWRSSSALASTAWATSNYGFFFIRLKQVQINCLNDYKFYDWDTWDKKLQSKTKSKGKQTNKQTNKQKRFISLIPCYLHTLFPHAFNQSANGWWDLTLTFYVQLSLVLQVPGYIHISVHILLVVYTFPFLSFMLRRQYVLSRNK